MDNFETASNCSSHSDSLQSNASSVSGLSSYGNEFAELRYLVNPSKYPQPYLDRSSTPKAELKVTELDNDKLSELQNNLRQSLQLNEQYKFQLHNLEKKFELKYCDKIDRLLRSNSRLEGELKNANNQTERLIQSYKTKPVSLILHEKLDLERKVHQLRSDFSELQRQSAKTLQDKYEVDLENKRLKINLGDLLTERDIKNSTIQKLKQKVSNQHVELQNTLKNNNQLHDSLNLISTKLAESDKSKVWYKEQLSQYQNAKVKLNKELIKCKNYITSLNEKIFNLNIDLSKYKNEVDEVRLKALKEKEELFKKLDNINENINLDCNVPANLNNAKNTFKEPYKYDIQYYEHVIEDLRAEVSGIRAIVIDKDKEFEKLNHENSVAISKCLILQKILSQKEADIEILKSSKNEVMSKLEYLKKNENGKLHEILQLKSRITELEIVIKIRNQEKQDVEESVQFIRAQFLKFKEHYEKVKYELDLKNKDILQLEKDKQELFMNNNWTLCELDKIKHKDMIIEELKKENENLATKIENLTKKIRLAEFQKLKTEKIIVEKENANFDELVHKRIVADQEAKILLLQDELNEASEKLIEFENALDSSIVNLESKDLKLSQTLEVFEQQKNTLKQLSSEKQNICESLNILQEKYKYETESKDKHIRDLNSKLENLELEWQSYLKRITDDQKVELLLNKQKSSSVPYFTANGNIPDRNLLDTPIFAIKDVENQIGRFFDNLNIEEFESTVDIRLKYLDERIQKIRWKSEKLEEKLNNKFELSKIKELEILLQVKDRDMQEKQKKMDRNNRTLLRKVKEHMRGRNAAEKQLKYLQDLYNTVADNCNTSKLSISSKDYEIQTLQEFCSNYKMEIEKLRNVIIKLEQNQFTNRICEKCIEYENVNEKIIYFKTFCEELQQRNKHLEEELQCKTENVVVLEKKIKEQEIQNQSQQEELSNFLEKCEEDKASLIKLQHLESTNGSQAELIKELENKLLEKDDLCRISVETAKKLKQDLIEAAEKIEFLSNEIQKIEYSQELEEKIKKLEEQSFHMNANCQINITEYKKRIYSMQSHIKVLKNDKFFLQRLSNDLKVALNSYIDHNKNLQTQLRLLSMEQQPFRSLPANFLDNISLSGKYDEKYISQLLAENRAPSASRPVTEEFEGCLSKLREEIFSLQNQISKKNNTVNLNMG